MRRKIAESEANLKNHEIVDISQTNSMGRGYITLPPAINKTLVYDQKWNESAKVEPVKIQDPKKLLLPIELV